MKLKYSTLEKRPIYIHTVPFVNNEYGKRNRSFYVPKMFNNLPEPLLKLEKINKLKKLLKQHFFTTNCKVG